MAKKIRVGFIAAGGIAAGHWHRLHATGKAQVVALNDPSKEKLKQFYQRCPGSDKLPVYKDYRDMLKNEQLDAVVVQSPHYVHFEQSMTSLVRGEDEEGRRGILLVLAALDGHARISRGGLL